MKDFGRCLLQQVRVTLAQQHGGHAVILMDEAETRYIHVPNPVHSPIEHALAINRHGPAGIDASDQRDKGQNHRRTEEASVLRNQA